MFKMYKLSFRLGAIFFDTEMKLADAFSAALEEVNAINPALKLDAIKRYVTVDDSIVLQDICEYWRKYGSGAQLIL